jgi:hypothetical protein
VVEKRLSLLNRGSANLTESAGMEEMIDRNFQTIGNFSSTENEPNPTTDTYYSEDTKAMTSI